MGMPSLISAVARNPLCLAIDKAPLQTEYQKSMPWLLPSQVPLSHRCDTQNVGIQYLLSQGEGNTLQVEAIVTCQVSPMVRHEFRTRFRQPRHTLLWKYYFLKHHVITRQKNSRMLRASVSSMRNLGSSWGKLPQLNCCFECCSSGCRKKLDAPDDSCHPQYSQNKPLVFLFPPRLVTSKLTEVHSSKEFWTELIGPCGTTAHTSFLAGGYSRDSQEFLFWTRHV